MRKLLLFLASILSFNFSLLAQNELIEVESAIQISQNIDPTPDPGTIRWTGSDFEGWNGVIWVSLTGGITVGSVTDIDGNTYQTIKIGDQEWMLENLKTTTFNDGTPIAEWSFGLDWWNGTNPIPYYQWADTNDPGNIYPDPLPVDFYGAIYNDFAISSGKLAPIGWRIPTEQDFIDLENFIAGNGQAGNEAIALKSTTGWAASSGNGTDTYGFNALPSGYVSAFGSAVGNQLFCILGTSDVDPVSQTRKAIMLFDQSTIQYDENSNRLGVAIRCIKE